MVDGLTLEDCSPGGGAGAIKIRRLPRRVDAAALRDRHAGRAALRNAVFDDNKIIMRGNLPEGEKNP